MTHFAIDPRVSRLTVKVTAGGMISAFGHSPTVAAHDFTGDLHFDRGSFGHARMAFRVGTDSFDVHETGNEQDRQEIARTMSESVLETAKYPEITFESSNVRVESRDGDEARLHVDGTLALHGTRKPLDFEARVMLTGSLLRASGEFEVKQSDFGIARASVAGGVLKVRDELRCTFDIVAREQPAADE